MENVNRQWKRQTKSKPKTKSKSTFGKTGFQRIGNQIELRIVGNSGEKNLQIYYYSRLGLRSNQLIYLVLAELFI
jgi:hypothetical protein